MTHPSSIARQLRGAVLVAVLCAPTSALTAQVTAPVPLESRTYERLDDLLASGLGGQVIVGQRPYSRLMVGQVVHEARAALTARRDLAPSQVARLDRVIAALEDEYAEEVARFSGASAAPVRARVDGAAVELTVLDSRARPIEDVGLGTVDAVVDPLRQGRGGRAYGERLTAAGEAAVSREIGEHVAVVAQARIATARPEGEVRALNATFGGRNVVVQVGRAPVQFGQGLAGGVFASRNAPGLDMVRIGTDRPARLPWVFGRLGPAMGSLFVADLGADQHFPHTKMAGWKVSFLPSRRFEIGASLMSIQGGEGGPPATFGERVVDVLTIIDVLLYQDRDLLFSNKLAGVDFRLRLPRGEIYFDGMLDDFDARRIGSSLWEDAGYATGLVVPGLGPGGSLRVDVEFQHTGLRYYQHVQFKSGVTSRGNLLGLPLGPRGDALSTRLRWDPARGRILQAIGSLERRSGDRYTVVTGGANDAGWQFVKVEDRPEETRARLLFGGEWEVPRARARIVADAGGERVLDAGFVAGAARTNLLARLAFVVGFD